MRNKMDWDRFIDESEVEEEAAVEAEEDGAVEATAATAVDSAGAASHVSVMEVDICTSARTWAGMDSSCLNASALAILVEFLCQRSARHWFHCCEEDAAVSTPCCTWKL